MRFAFALLFLPALAHAEDPLDAGVPAKMVAAFTLRSQELAHQQVHLPQAFVDAHPAESLQATYRVCLGTDGHVSGTSIMVPVGEVDDELQKQIRVGWIYQPQPQPVCFAAVVKFQITDPPDAGAPSPQWIFLNRRPLSHPQPKLPPAFAAAHAGEELLSTYKVCLAPDGHVLSTSVMKGLGNQRVDEVVMKQIREGWIYKPQQIATCFTAFLKFKVN